MKVLKVFVDFADAMKELNDAERGRLFTAMLEYARSGAAPVFRGAEKVLWPVAKGAIDNQQRAYNHICEVNRQNVTNRYEPLRYTTNRREPLQDKEKTKNYIDEEEEDKEDLLPRAREEDDPVLKLYDKAIGAVRAAYLASLGRAPTIGEAQRLSTAAVNTDMVDLLAEAIDLASRNGARNVPGYAIALLNEWRESHVKTYADLQKYERIKQGMRAGDYSAMEALREFQKIKEG